MLLSPSRSKTKQTTINPFPTKVFKATTSQTTRSKTVLANSDSDEDDDNSDATPPKSHFQNQTKELTLKIRYQISHDASPFHLPHVQLLQFLNNNIFPNIVILNKRCEVLKVAAIMSLNNQEVYLNHFEPHHRERQTESVVKEVVIIQTLRTSLSLSEIKRQTGVIDYLKTHNIQLSAHEWTTSIWNVQSIGFLTKYSPTHQPKELVLFNMNKKYGKINNMPQFKLKPTSVATTINKQRIRVQVYAIEVQAKDAKMAEKVMLTTSDSPEDFISFRMKRMNYKAFQHAIAMVAQTQNDLRTIVLNNISEEAYFVLESAANQVNKIRTVHHIKSKKSMRIVTFEENFLEVRRTIRNLLPSWIEQLDPSDLRTCGDTPTLVTIRDDELSENTASDLSNSIDSLLSLDIYELNMFHFNSPDKETSEKPVSDLTMSNTEDRLLQHQAIIDTQGKRIDELLDMIQ